MVSACPSFIIIRIFFHILNHPFPETVPDIHGPDSHCRPSRMFFRAETFFAGAGVVRFRIWYARKDLPCVGGRVHGKAAVGIRCKVAAWI